jgi:hypothetical protein
MTRFALAFEFALELTLLLAPLQPLSATALSKMMTELIRIDV